MDEEIKTTADTQTTESVVESIGNPEKQPETPEITPEKQPPAESDGEKNFKIMREKAKRAERERDELAQRINAYESAKAAAPVEDEPDDLGIDSDSYVEGKHFKAMHKELRNVRKELSAYKAQSSATSAEIKLKSTCPDFDRVVSQDNIDLLNDLHPEIAETIKNSNADIYGKAVTAYTVIKNLGIAKDDNFEKEKRRIQENAAKPKPLSSIQPQVKDGPLSGAAAFTETISQEEKNRLWQEMLASRRRH
jgi:multidrug efflux pump subunit AcrB